jgi:hypothetical protein
MAEQGRKPEVKFRRAVLLTVLVVFALVGCKRKEDGAANSSPVRMVNAAEIAAVRNAMTQGMTAVTFDKLAEAHVGHRCVVTARTPDQADPPPPPLGMVRIMGATTIYSAELHEVSPRGLKIRAAYPTSGNLKIIEIPRQDLQSIHIAP